MSLVITAVLGIAAVWLGLPALVDCLAFIAGIMKPHQPAPKKSASLQRLLFLVPAHDEELLIERCISSIQSQDYPRAHYDLYVIADNCSDGTAAVASRLGAQVVERIDAEKRGKHHAIEWALERIGIEDYDAVIVIDADATVNVEYAGSLNSWPDLRTRALHTYDGMTNEFENWLTRLAGLLTRNRYDIGLPLKARAGLSCPLTGDGMVLGTALLQQHGWNIKTITEGWELYARLTVEGTTVGFEPRAVFYDQEARSLGQSAAQRERWAAGRVEVLRMYWKRIAFGAGLPLLQRLDLFAELTSLGPVLRATGTVAALVLVLGLRPPGHPVIVILLGVALLHLGFYTLLSLSRHPQRLKSVQAFMYLPLYTGWRLILSIRSLFRPTSPGWVRTVRHKEGDIE